MTLSLVFFFILNSIDKCVSKNKYSVFKNRKWGEQDGGGVDVRGVHLSPQMHQEYTFRHRNACRTPVESRQEYMTSGKEYIEPHKTQ